MARDLDATRAALIEWLATRPGVSDPEVVGLEIPMSTGWSNETILFTAHWGGEERRLVARVEPTVHTVFLEANFENQYRVMRALHESTDVPMPALHWFEPDRSWLGGAFWIMDRVEGRAPTDNPPYTMEGWLKDSAPEDQARVWWTGVEAMARVHRTDWRELGLAFLDDPARGRAGLPQQLQYYTEYLDWAEADTPHLVARAGLEWLRINQLPDLADDDLALCWGDSRLSNEMFLDHRCVAVLDWEMATLGDPQQDLAWWLALDTVFSERMGADRLPGFPSAEQTVAAWEDLTGRKADALRYYLVFAAFRFAVIMCRIFRLWFEVGLLPNDDLARDNFASQYLAALLERP